jgi:hypothetical protein
MRNDKELFELIESVRPTPKTLEEILDSQYK